MKTKVFNILKQFLGISIQLGGLVALLYVPWTTLPLSFYIFITVYLFIGQFSFSAGWHRGMAHRAFDAPEWLQWIFFFGGSMNFLGSLIEFLAEHQPHHSALNTKRDPTHRAAGWWHSHIGWVGRYEVEKSKVEKIVDSNKMFERMNKIWLISVIFFSWIFPVFFLWL